MAEVFNLELHDGDNLIESDDDIIEVDEVSGFGFSVNIFFYYHQPQAYMPFKMKFWYNLFLYIRKFYFFFSLF